MAVTVQIADASTDHAPRCMHDDPASGTAPHSESLPQTRCDAQLEAELGPLTITDQAPAPSSERPSSR